MVLEVSQSHWVLVRAGLFEVVVNGDGCGSAWLEGSQTASWIICFKPMWPVNRSWVEHQVLVPHTTHDSTG